MRIGIFDSGVGGITVLKRALEFLPDESFLYYADTQNVPYGTKSKDEVKAYVFDAVDFILKQGIKALVIACNTATSVAINDLRKEYKIPILGMEPAVKPAVEKNKGKRVLVAATPITLAEEKYHNLVDKLHCGNIVDGLPLPELVNYAENFEFDENVIMSYLKEKLAPYDTSQYGTVVLGCTHFPFYREYFRKLFPEGTDIIDGSTGTARYLRKVIYDNKLEEKGGKGDIVFYSSKIKEDSNSRYMKYLKLLD